MSELTDKQQRFVEEYLIDLNATDAAKRAGYSAKTAHVQGPRLLGNVRVAEAIQEAQGERSERTQLTADEVLRELAALCRSDVRHFAVDSSGVLTLNPDAPDDAWRAVASVQHKITKDGTRTIEYRLWDKNSAIDKAMRHLGILATEVNVNVNAVEQFLMRRHAAQTNGNGHSARA